jgi:hypothetical protein
LSGPNAHPLKQEAQGQRGLLHADAKIAERVGILNERLAAHGTQITLAAPPILAVLVLVFMLAANNDHRESLPLLRLSLTIEVSSCDWRKPVVVAPPRPCRVAAGFLLCLIKVYRNQSAMQWAGIDFGKLFSYHAGMVKKQSNRGGRRKGAGRPALPPDERRDQVFSVKLTADEKLLLDETGARKWARDVLLRSASRRTK